MRDPTRILVEKEKLALDGIQQYYVDVKREEWKLDTLLDLYEVIALAQTMIFVANRRKADWLAAQLGAAGHACSVIHGELEQAESVKVTGLAQKLQVGPIFLTEIPY